MIIEPGWVTGAFAVLMVGVSAYCFGRLVLARRLRRTLHYDVNFAHSAEGLAMAGMLSSGLNFLPDPLWEALFSGFAAWFVLRGARFVRQYGFAGRSDHHRHSISRYLTHLVLSCSMLYMYFAASPARVVAGGGMAMGANPATADYLFLPLIFVVVLTGSAVWHIDALSRFSTPALASVGGGTTVAGGGEVPWLAPRLEMGCHIAMCVAMAFMLVLMF
ncbi:MAG TPA: DUF5134 domain-containing protein [Acidimicrobiales bacterium]|nr:DUF5134 domain-containing protein [Acidimicrobiales bacterium]